MIRNQNQINGNPSRLAQPVVDCSKSRECRSASNVRTSRQDKHALRAKQSLGKFGRECAIESSLELGDSRQACIQSIANRLVARCVRQIATGCEDAHSTRSGDQQKLNQRVGRTLRSVVFQSQRLRQPVVSKAVDLIIGDEFSR